MPARAQLALGQFRQLESARDRLSKSGNTERFERHPDFQRAKTSCQLNSVIAWIELGGFAVDVAQIVRSNLKGRFQQCDIAHQNAAALKRLKEPFVRIERDRIGALQPGQETLPARR